MLQEWKVQKKVALLKYMGKRKRKECHICLKAMTGGTVKLLPCGHQFHRRCVAKWIRTNNTCPVCRGTIVMDQLNDIRGGVSGGNVLEIEYGRDIRAPLPDPMWQPNSQDDGYTRGTLFLVQDPRLQEALSYMILSHFMKNRYYEDEPNITQYATPETITYHDILLHTHSLFEVHDWSEIFLGTENDDLRPPFSIVHQVIDDGIHYEKLQINDVALIRWWEANRNTAISAFTTGTF